MKWRKLLALPPILVVAVIVVSSVAISGTTYTWEKTFEVTKPEIECEIEISDRRVIGCPVKVWVMLKSEEGCGKCRYKWEAWKDKCDDDWDDECDDDWEKECCYQINGTYSVQLHWWNETQEDWQHLMYLQEEINITLTCCKNIETYTFTPKMEGEYKIVVTFATETETLDFSSEN